MKILELTNYSAGTCGVFSRVLEESKRLSRKHEVRIFSSNLTKGTNEIAPPEEKIGLIKITRFQSTKIAGESYMLWGKPFSFSKEVKRKISKFNPDIIMVHGYRHNHTKIVSEISKKINAKSFLVTHAPFIEKDITRSLISKMYVRFYDKFLAKRRLKKFDKIIAITKWEIPILRRLGVPLSKIAYIPNGIPEEFFTQKKGREENKILFLGRISPIKDLETLILAFSKIKDDLELEIVGPAEEKYFAHLKKLISFLGLERKVIFSGPIYDLNQKIKKIDSAKIFILPSKSEAMPQSLIEAMAREKIVISSNNRGSSAIIENGKNGYLFKVGDSKDLSDCIVKAFSKKNSSSMKKQARKSVKEFSWRKIIKKIEYLL